MSEVEAWEERSVNLQIHGPGEPHSEKPFVLTLKRLEILQAQNLMLPESSFLGELHHKRLSHTV